jgi:glycosyltransferase involved in cell wall biosynthesis
VISISRAQEESRRDSRECVGLANAGSDIWPTNANPVSTVGLTTKWHAAALFVFRVHRPMKVLLVHNRYLEQGGEDLVVDSEERLLIAAGHTVQRYQRDNAEIKRLTLLQKTLLPATTLWSIKSRREVQLKALRDKPAIAHFHNTFPLISPAAYSACRKAGVPVVQTLHNYRLLCPAATLLRKGRPCELCLGKAAPWPAVVHACYRDSRTTSGVVAAMLAAHRTLGTWTEMVDVYIALSEFARNKFIEGGLPAGKILVKPNFVHPDPGPGRDASDYALFVGRLYPEKGLRTLLNAWAQTRGRICLRVLGDGPMRQELESQVQNLGLSQVRFEGGVGHKTVLEAMRGARFLVVPSECYENFPMAIVEAFACSAPIIAADVGAIREIVTNGHTGLHFVSGSAQDLAGKVEWAWTHPREMEAMGRAGRAEFEAKYTAEQNYRMLMAIYAQAMRS